MTDRPYELGEEPPALPSGDDILALPENEESINIDRGYSQQLVQQAEEVHDLINSAYQMAIDRKNLDRKDIENEDLDEDLVTTAVLEIPEAVEELGDEIEKARRVESSIAGPGKADISGDYAEEEFLENYREAEGLYREVFQQIDRPIDGRGLSEFIDDRYRIDFTDSIGEVPDPRADHR